MPDEQKTAKVVEIKNVRSKETTYGTMFYFNIKLDNGDIGQIGKKKEDGIKVGQTLVYTTTTGDYGNSFKEVQTGGFGGRGGGASVTIDTKRETALKCAMQLFALRCPDGAKDKKVNEVVSGVEKIADLFYSYLTKK